MKIGTFINHGTIIEIESVQTMNLSVDKGQVCIGDQSLSDFVRSAATQQEAASEGEEDKFELPDVLSTPQAQALFAKLHSAGLLGEGWQPVGLSNSEKGTLIEYMAEELDIRHKWKLFGTLWKVDSETLRTAKARGLDQDKTWKFRQRLDAL